MLEGDEVAGRLRAAFAGNIAGGIPWVGTATDLQAALLVNYEPTKYWPALPRSLAVKVRRLAPALRKEGVDVQFSRSHGKGVIRIDFSAATSDTGQGVC